MNATNSIGQKPPEIKSAAWLNVDEPPKLNDYNGKVLLIKFWSFGCIDCRNSMQNIDRWLDLYSKDGLRALSVHTPELDYEKNVDHLKKAAQDLKIEFPIAVDNDYRNFKAYQNSVIPTIYLVARDGTIAYVSEGPYDAQTLESKIKKLIAK